MDGDLAEAVSELKEIFAERNIDVRFEQADPSIVERARRRLPLTERYTSFLRESDPVDVETSTPSESIRFVPAADLVTEQLGYSLGDDETPARDGWRPSWIVIAHSTMLGDPYFLDTSRSDVEGDCPVMTAMSGTDRLDPILCASSFACFLRILTASMQVATGFGDDSYDDQDDAIFREAIGPKIKVIDAAALRAGHWT